MKKLVLFVCVVSLAIGANVYALDFGTDITISDENYTTQNWYKNQEDQEVEPGMVHGQIWDLEGFFQKDSQLTMIGGYDFLHGERGSQLWTSGDIFIDINGDAQYGDIHGSSNGNKTVANTFGYDFVLDLDFASMSYQVFQIDATSRVKTAYYKQNQGSNPWQYVDGGEELSDYSGTIGYSTELSDSETGFAGGWHNAVVVDLGFLAQGGYVGDNYKAIVHFTMQCGNDNLMGEFDPGSPVPEPSTVLLLGLGLLGLVGIGKKRITK